MKYESQKKAQNFYLFAVVLFLMQMLFGWASPISLAVWFKSGESERCTDCLRCEDACFMDVVPRSEKRNINCVNCGKCINACRRELGSSRELFHYSRKKKK